MDLKKVYLISQCFTLLTVLVILILPGFIHDSRTAIILIFALLIMLIAGVLNILIAAKARMKDIVVYLCVIEFIALFIVFVYYIGASIPTD
jgi:hypothetical protein